MNRKHTPRGHVAIFILFMGMSLIVTFALTLALVKSIPAISALNRLYNFYSDIRTMIGLDNEGSIKGIDPLASAALRRAGLDKGDVLQGLGNAAASVGFHRAEPGSKYTAAVDVRTRGRSQAQIDQVLHNMRMQGFAAWYRHEGGWANNKHIHAVYAGVTMKNGLLKQVKDFIGLPLPEHGINEPTASRNGEAGHRVLTNPAPAPEELEAVRQVYATVVN